MNLRKKQNNLIEANYIIMRTVIQGRVIVFDMDRKNSSCVESQIFLHMHFIVP